MLWLYFYKCFNLCLDEDDDEEGEEDTEEEEKGKARDSALGGVLLSVNPDEYDSDISLTDFDIEVSQDMDLSTKLI